MLLLAERKTGQACETLNKPFPLVSLGTLKNKVLQFFEGRMQMERTNKRRQAQREIEEQGNTTKHKGGCPESRDVITTQAAAWALDRNWVNERAVHLPVSRALRSRSASI
jgi:hypothetical protein